MCVVTEVNARTQRKRSILYVSAGAKKIVATEMECLSSHLLPGFCETTICHREQIVELLNVLGDVEGVKINVFHIVLVLFHRLC